jgi:AcrR family transcriptional regulator
MRNEILQTALEQFLKFGIHEMSIKKLIEPLGISTKTVYKYFKNKEELLEEVLRVHYNQQYQLVENLTSERNVVPLLFDIWYFAIEHAFNVNNLFYKDLHHYFPELERKIEVEMGSKFGIQFQNLIQKGINERVFKEDILPEVAMEGIYVLYNAIARTELYERFGVSPRNIFLSSIALYIRGFCTPNGIQELEDYIVSQKPFEKKLL